MAAWNFACNARRRVFGDMSNTSRNILGVLFVRCGMNLRSCSGNALRIIAWACRIVAGFSFPKMYNSIGFYLWRSPAAAAVTCTWFTLTALGGITGEAEVFWYCESAWNSTVLGGSGGLSTTLVEVLKVQPFWKEFWGESMGIFEHPTLQENSSNVILWDPKIYTTEQASAVKSITYSNAILFTGIPEEGGRSLRT